MSDGYIQIQFQSAEFREILCFFSPPRCYRGLNEGLDFKKQNLKNISVLYQYQHPGGDEPAFASFFGDNLPRDILKTSDMRTENLCFTSINEILESRVDFGDFNEAPHESHLGKKHDEFI